MIRTDNPKAVMLRLLQTEAVISIEVLTPNISFSL